MSRDAKVVPASMEQYKQLLVADFPQLEVKSIKYLGSGWDSAAILVNEEFVFRFPRGLFEAGERIKTNEIEKEVNILNYLKDKVSFAVPKPVFIAPGFRYFGYNLLSGTLWDQVGEKEQLSDGYLHSWVQIRSEISKIIPAEKAQELDIPRYHTQKNEELVQQYLTNPNADDKIKKMAKAAMEYVLGNTKNNGSWNFVHEDLQMSNCFVDPTAQKITGVIDWLEAEIAPIEAEFYFWSKWGRDTLDKVAKMQQEYDGTTVNTDLARAIHQFYIVADYQDFTNRGFAESAARKWRQITEYIQ